MAQTATLYELTSASKLEKRACLRAAKYNTCLRAAEYNTCLRAAEYNTCLRDAEYNMQYNRRFLCLIEIGH